MHGVKKIEIKISELNIIVNLDEKNILINDKSCRINISDIENLFRIIRGWDNYYIDNNLIDAEEFFVNIFSSDNIEYIYGKGKYPENFNELKRWVEVMYARTIL